MNVQPIVAALHRKYHEEKWILSPREIWRIHDSMGIVNRKFHLHVVTEKLNQTGSGIWFGLKSGIIFDQNEFMLIGDAMDSLHHGYTLKTGIKEIFQGFEGYTLYYLNDGVQKKLTVSGPEKSFLKELFVHCERRAESAAA